MTTRMEAQQARRNRERAQRRSEAARLREAGKQSERGQAGMAAGQSRNDGERSGTLGRPITPPGRNEYHGERGQTPEMAPSGLSGRETTSLCGCPCHDGETRWGVPYWRPARGHSLDCKPANWARVAREDGRDWSGWDSCSVSNASRWRHGLPLVSRRACRAQEHADRECYRDFEGPNWADLGPSEFPNKVAA